MSKYSVEDGHVGCEPDDKCCLCLPIGLGVKILAVLSIIGACFSCVTVIEALSSFILLIFVGGSTFFFVIAALIYLKFLMSDD